MAFMPPIRKLLPQILGQDLITLVLGVPLLLGCVKLTQKGSLKGVLLWTGLLFYFAYSYYFYVVGVRFNTLFLVYIAIVALSLYGLLALLNSTAGHCPSGLPLSKDPDPTHCRVFARHGGPVYRPLESG